MSTAITDQIIEPDGLFPIEKRKPDNQQSNSMSSSMITSYLLEFMYPERLVNINSTASTFNITDNLIKHIENVLSVNNKEKIIARLEQLIINSYTDQDEESLSYKSLANYIDFLQNSFSLKYSAIGLTPDGNIYIEWEQINQFIIGLEFLENNDISYNVLIKGPYNSSKYQTHIYGVNNYSNVIKLFKKLNIDFFIKE